MTLPWRSCWSPSWMTPCSRQTRTANSSGSLPCPPNPSPCGRNCWRAPWKIPCATPLKYAREFIKVDWYREGREWVMTIRDDGPGVPVEQQPRLFLPFFRVDDARNAKTGGTGLGLAIAAEAIQRHGDHPGQQQSADRTGHHHPSAHALTSPFHRHGCWVCWRPFRTSPGSFHARYRALPTGNPQHRQHHSPLRQYRLPVAPDRALGFEWDDKRVKRAGLDYHEFADVKRWPDYEAFLAAVAPNGSLPAPPRDAPPTRRPGLPR